MKYRLLKHSSIYLYAVMAVCSLGIISVPGDCVVINNDSSLNVYNPFDDPKPKIPQEIIDDSRLDKRIKVFVKSKNLKDLFEELSAKTSVRVRASREIAGERAIIYFHDRPVRDVMTEVSGLFGYYWLVKGKPGEYSYELFEDIRHAKRRESLRDEQHDMQVSLLLELAKAATADVPYPEMKQRDPEMYQSQVDTGKFIAQFNKDFLKKVLVQDETVFSFSYFSPSMQSAICEWRNTLGKYRWDQEQRKLVENPNWHNCTASDLEGSTIGFRRSSQGLFGFPRITLSIKTEQQGNCTSQWPFWGLNYDQLWQMAEKKAPEKLIGDPIEDETKITKTVDRKIFAHGRADALLLIGDVLEAIGEQSELDVIADYQFQESFFPNGFSGVLVGKIVAAICEQCDYTCQSDEPTLRFRFNKWFVRDPLQQPSSKVVEACWRKLETVGRLETDDLLNLAVLPEKQALWPGFVFMPGVNIARRSPATMRLWSSLRPYAEQQARTEQGISVSGLNAVQLSHLYAWAKPMRVNASQEDLMRAVIRIDSNKHDITKSSNQNTETHQIYFEEFALVLPDGTRYPSSLMLPPALSEKDRAELVKQRQKDRESDKIEVLD